MVGRWTVSRQGDLDGIEGRRAEGYEAGLPAADVGPAWRWFTPRPARLRRLAIIGHRYVGLTMAVFLIVAGLTGSLIAFYHELDVLLNPGLFKAEAPTQEAEPLDPFVLRERLLSGLDSEVSANHVNLDRENGQSARFWVEAPTEGEDDEYFVDPYTGKILGSRRYGDLTQGVENLMPFIYRLHYSLGLGTVGIYLFGIVALLWTLDCFVGAYLTFPSSRRNGQRTGPARSWLARWKTSWLVRTTKLFSFVFTWHRASGLWVWAMLFVFAWSAVGLNLREVYNPVMKAAFGMPKRAYFRLPELHEPRPQPALSFSEARTRGRVLMAQEAAGRNLEVYDERRIAYYPARGAFRYTVQSSADISDRYPNTTVWFDGEQGDFLAFDVPTGENRGTTITSWLYHLHFGSIAIGGWPYRIFVSLMGLAVAALSITGVWIWWRKRRKRMTNVARESEFRTGGREIIKPGPAVVRVEALGPKDNSLI